MVDPSRGSCPGFIVIIYVVNHRGNIEIGSAEGSQSLFRVYELH